MNGVARLERGLALAGPLAGVWLASPYYVGDDGKTWADMRGQTEWGSGSSLGPQFQTATGAQGALEINYPTLNFWFVDQNRNVGGLVNALPGCTFVGAVQPNNGNAMFAVNRNYGSPDLPRLAIGFDSTQVAFDDADTTDSATYSSSTSAQILTVSIDVPTTTVSVYRNKTNLVTDTSCGVASRSSWPASGAQYARLGTLNWTCECRYYAFALIQRSLDEDGCNYVSDVMNRFFKGEFY